MAAHLLDLLHDGDGAPADAYATLLDDARRANWELDDVLDEHSELDFSRAFLPESMARTRLLRFLDARGRLTLNQIRGHSYLGIFSLIETFIAPFLVELARDGGDDEPGNSPRSAALNHAAQDEGKHIELFRRFSALFESQAPFRSELIGPAEELARAVLAHQPLAVALVVLHFEWMTQRHETEAAAGAQDLDPLFCSLLEHHGQEEAQHARLDELLIQSLAEGLSPTELDHAVDDYLQIVALVDDRLSRQVELDLVGLEPTLPRGLGASERGAFRRTQRAAYRWTFLGSGMSHPRFLAAVEALSSEARGRVEAVAAAFR